jgi:hypothetical protein
MTPLKIVMSDDNGEFDSLMNTSMDEGSHCSETVTVSSPPRSTLSFSASRPAGGGFGSAASRLFADDDEDDEEHEGPILKPLDLNMELPADGAAAGCHEESFANHTAHTHGDRGGSRTPFRHRGGHKRQAERQLVARDLSFDDAEDDDDDQQSPTDMMLMSPRISPSCYRSPFRPAPAATGTASTATVNNKSPCYRTMDGRTVQSKNPFSPMYTDESSSACAQSITTATALSDSLNFPVSLESSSSHGPSPGGPLLRHRLQKRDTNLNPSAFPSFAASTAAQYYTRDGYPEREGRYSFTGSPIRETNMETELSDPPMLNGDVPHKVRRRTKHEDIPGAVTASSLSGESSNSFYLGLSERELKNDGPESIQHRRPSPLDMQDINFGSQSSNRSLYRWEDEISPTDVMSFSPGTPVPPTPSKPAKGRPKTHKYTPVRKPSVPPTPMPERRSHRTSLDDSTETTNHSMQQQSSRFYSDFDVIGELGNGSFGNVFKVMSRLDGCMYAIKVAHRPAKGTADKDRMLKEVSFGMFSFVVSALSLSLRVLTLLCRFTHSQHCRINQTLRPFTLFDTIKRGWKNIDCIFRRSSARQPCRRRFNKFRRSCYPSHGATSFFVKFVLLLNSFTRMEWSIWILSPRMSLSRMINSS